MLIKSITLENFRQYKEKQMIRFSTDTKKNVTIIIGENGIGKTTFLQAFLWCLYGYTDFSDKNYLNKIVREEMFVGDEKTVFVELRIIHAEKEYSIKRRLIYEMSNSHEIKEKSSSQFEILIKNDEDGQFNSISYSDTSRIIQEILPKDLSTYFFFDNERLGKMSEEINKKEVSETFSKAVRNLLGLTAMEKTIEHLNGNNNNNSVVALYRKEYTSTTNNKLSDAQAELSIKTAEREKIEKNIVEIDNTLKALSEALKDYDKQLEDNAASEELAKRKTDYQDEINNKEKDIVFIKRDFLKDFNSKIYSFIIFKLINDVGELLKNKNIKDAGIPEIRDTTINYLVNIRKSCLCGAHIEEGNSVYNSLIELLNHIPPQSLDRAIYDFISECHSKIISTNDFENDLRNKFKRIKEANDYIDNKNDAISDIEKKLDNLIDINDIREKQKRTQKDKEDAVAKKTQLREELNKVLSEITELNNTIDILSKKDSKNNKINIWRAYAERLYEDIKAEYEENETRVRENLVKTVNEIYKQINGNDFSIAVDSKYHIQITDSKAGKWIEASTGQTNSAILSFISGCIKLARRDISHVDEGVKLSEPYPLVMDALFSALDELHMKQICDIIPNITEQTIIFTIKKDWNVAQKYLSDKVGKIYIFDRVQPYSLLIKEQ